ncbi:hypothetical protein C7447_10764 [Tenacibaculum adriaticum]|uniref:Uncharacterized protein n=1 Tax=Tenacibaculum adriaticum TaxID=413713 RepID=A0A5S5DM84_9FLAO|nr:hypothetical protein C7447_10764 [Tenacibaculum adriaticum]
MLITSLFKKEGEIRFYGDYLVFQSNNILMFLKLTYVYNWFFIQKTFSFEYDLTEQE